MLFTPEKLYLHSHHCHIGYQNHKAKSRWNNVRCPNLLLLPKCADEICMTATGSTQGH